MLRCMFFKDTATTEIYTLSLHDALPISVVVHDDLVEHRGGGPAGAHRAEVLAGDRQSLVHLLLGIEQGRSEEHTSELQSRQYLVCRLLLDKTITLSQYIPFFAPSSFLPL